MRAFLNDWSLTSVTNVFSNWDRILAFYELAKELAGRCGLEIIAPSNLWDIPLSGCDLRTMSTRLSHDAHLSSDQWLFLKNIYRKMKLSAEGLPLFSEKEDLSNPSSSVGHAAHEHVPVMSFTFDDHYATDTIGGWLHEIDGSVDESEVINVYEIKADNYRYFADLNLCRHIDPLKNPLWNTDLVAGFLNGVDFVNVDGKQRQGMLIEYGKIVAEMNGWRYNHEISVINRTSDRLRYIFDSSNFVDYKMAYLSIDLEGPELAFELCDKQGRHLGEYSWNGSHKAAKTNHDIKVKR